LDASAPGRHSRQAKNSASSISANQVSA
jgi:hypothetical protein